LREYRNFCAYWPSVSYMQLRRCEIAPAPGEEEGERLDEATAKDGTATVVSCPADSLVCLDPA
jgi:hypothetical protein